MANRRYHDYLSEDEEYPARQGTARGDEAVEEEPLEDPWEEGETIRFPRRSERELRSARSGFNWNELPVWTGVAILLFVVAVGGGLWLMTRSSNDDASSAGAGTSASTQAPGATARSTARAGTPGGPTPIIAGNTPVPPPPANVAAGVRVAIFGTGADKLRVRAGPGSDYATLMIVPDGTEFKVLEGPQEQGGYKWWRLEAADGTTGWAAERFLKPIGQ